MEREAIINEIEKEGLTLHGMDNLRLANNILALQSPAEKHADELVGALKEIRKMTGISSPYNKIATEALGKVREES